MIRMFSGHPGCLGCAVDTLTLEEHARGSYQTILEQQVLAASAREEDAMVLVNFVDCESLRRDYTPTGWAKPRQVP